MLGFAAKQNINLEILEWHLMQRNYLLELILLYCSEKIHTHTKN